MQRENKKYSICITLFLLILSQLFVITPLVSAQSSYQAFEQNPLNFWTLNNVDADYYENNTIKLKSTLETFNYRKQINIVGSVGASTEYQIFVNVTYDSDMQTDFDDIRFTDNDGETQLDYWLDVKIDSTYAEFWVKVTDDLDSSKTIFMYYGNDDIETESSGEDTFIFFDDFENDNLDLWSSVGSDWGTSGSYYALGHYTGGGRDLKKTISLTDNCLLHADIKQTDGQYDRGFFFYPEDEGSIDVVALAVYAGYYQYYDGTSYIKWNDTLINLGEWYEVEVAFDYDADLIYAFQRGVSLGNNTLKDVNGNTVSSLTVVRSSLFTGTNDDMYIDDYYIRSWISSEPYVSSFEVETNDTLILGEAFIEIPLIQDKDVSVKSLIEIVEYYSSESIVIGVNTSLGVDPNFKYEINESLGNPIRFEVSCKQLINIYRFNLYTEFQAYLDKYIISHLINKEIKTLVIYLNGFTSDSSLNMYFLSGTVDYSYSALWDYTDGAVANELSRYEPDIFTAFSTSVNEEDEFLGEFNRTFETQITQFQYIRCYDNIQYDNEPIIVGDNFLTSKFTLIIGVHRIEFYTEQLHGGEAANIESSINIYNNGISVYVLNSAKSGYDPQSDLFINNFKVWRTFEDRLGVAFASDSELFRHEDDDRRTIEEFTYFYTDVVSNFSGSASIKYEAQIDLAADEHVNEQNDFREMEYDFNANFQIAEPHFSSTWYVMPEPFQNFLDWVRSVGGIIADSPLGEGVSDFFDYVDGLIEGMAPLFDNLIAVLSPLIESITDILAPILEDLGVFLGDLLANIITVLEPILDSIFSAFGTLFDSISDAIATWAQDAFETIVDLLIGVAAAIGDFIVWFINGIGLLLGITGLSGIIGDIISNFLTSITTFLSGFALIVSLMFDGIIFMITLVNTYLPTIILGATIIVLLHVSSAIVSMDEKIIMDMVSVYAKIFSFFLDIMFKLANAVIQFIGGIIP